MPDYTAGKGRILLEPSARGFFTKSRAAIRTEMTGKNLEQPVRLRADVTGFRTAAETELKKVRQLYLDVRLRPNIGNSFRFREDAKAQATQALKGSYVTFAARAHLDTSYADKQMTAWRLKQEARPIRIKVVAEYVEKDPNSHLGRAIGGRPAQARSTIQPDRDFAFGHNVPILKPRLDDTQVKADATKAAASIGNIMGKARVTTVDTKAATEKLRRDFFKTRKDIEENFKLRIQPNVAGIQLRLPLGILGFEAIPAAVAGIGQLIGAMQQLSQVALVLPGAISVAGASIGTFAIGITGLSAAWKAMTQESDRGANQATTDADRVARSSDQIRNAMVDQRKAQEDLTHARRDALRNLEDLHSEERSATLSVAEAAIDRRRALNELAKAPASGLERDEAVVRAMRANESLTDAIRRQGRTRQDVNEADKKGVTQADSVVAAQEALVRSNQQVAATLRQIQMESSAAANAQDKTAAAMAKLSPAGQDLLRTFMSLKDTALIPLRNIVQQNMFAGMSAQIKALVNDDMPLLQRGLGGIATGINGLLTQTAASLRTAGNQGILERIFGASGDTMARLQHAIDPLIRSIGTLAAAGAESMPRLVSGFTTLIDKAATFVETADKDGRLDVWINNGIKAAESLGRTIGNIVGIINGVSRAFGGGLITDIEGLTKRLSDFLNSAEGQHDLLDFIQHVREIFDSWRPVLTDLPGIMKAAMQAGSVAVQAFLPVLNLFTEVLEHSPKLIGAVVTAFLAWKVINPIITGIRGSFTSLAAVITEVGVAGGPIAAMQNRATKSASGIDAAFATVGKESSGPAKAAGRLSKVAGFLGAAGPIGLGIATLIPLLTDLSQGHAGAAEAAQQQAEAEERLSRSLDSVTNSAGAAARADLSKQLENWSPTDIGTIAGSVRGSVESLGISPSSFVTAIQPGGEKQADALRQKFRATAHDEVLKFFKEKNPGDPFTGPSALDILHQAGVDDDTIINATMGDQGAIKRVQDAIASVPGPDANIFDNWRVGVRESVERAGGGVKASVQAGQFLNVQQPALRRVQDTAQAAQDTAVGMKAQLTDTANSTFAGLTPKAFFDGNQAAVELHSANPDEITPLLDAFKKRGSSVRGPVASPQGWTTTILLSEADQRGLIKLVPSRKRGGPSPSGGIPGPTGGTLTELHDDEWVLPKHARRSLGDDWLKDVTFGAGRREKCPPLAGQVPGFFWGGGFPLDVPIPPIVPPVPTGPAPGPPVVAPTPGVPAVPGADPSVPVGVSHAGGPGVSPDSVVQIPSSLTVNPDGTPSNVTTPDFGSAFANQFLAPWGMQMGPDGPVSIAGPAGVGSPAGLGSEAGTDPGARLGTFGANLAMSFGSALFSGVLGFFGLSSDNKYFDAIKQTLGFYSKSLGANQQSDPYTQGLVDTSVSSVNGGPQLVQLDDGTIVDISGAQSQQGTGAGGQASIQPGGALPQGVAPEGNLQVDTIAAARGISSTFPGVKTIGGYRVDPGYPNEHPAGKAIDVMLPGGDAGKAPTGDTLTYGEGVKNYAIQHASDYGIEYAIWNGKMWYADGHTEPYTGPVPHYDHVHVHTAGGGYPGKDAQYMAPAGGIVPMTLDASGKLVAATPGTAAATPGGGPPTVSGSTTKRPGGKLPWGLPSSDDMAGASGPSSSTSDSSGGAAPPLPSAPAGGYGGGRTPGRSIGRLQRPLRRGRRVTGRPTAAPGGAPRANYTGGSEATHTAVYAAFKEAGYPDAMWPALVNIVNKESGWNPSATNPTSGAFGMPQFLGSTLQAYLPSRSTDPSKQGSAMMRYIHDRYGDPLKAWGFWQAHNWYADGGHVRGPGGPKGDKIPAMLSDREYVQPTDAVDYYGVDFMDAVRGRKLPRLALGGFPRGAVPTPLNPRKRKPVQGAITTPGPSAPAGPATPPRREPPPPPPAPAGPAPGPAPSDAAPPGGIDQSPVAPAPVAGAKSADNQHLAPGIAKGISSGAQAGATIASTALAAFPGAGPLAAGLINQGGKIISGLANVGATFASGFLKFDSSTPNPYGIQSRRKDAAPPLGQDNRRVHQGDNYFASMEDWRRRTQLQDAQDMQAQMTRMP